MIPDDAYLFEPPAAVPKSVHVVGRRWFQKSYGNTYFTADIYVDGELVHTLPKQYGYGDHYADMAYTWLEENNRAPMRIRHPNGGVQPAWQVAQDYGFEFTYFAHDVRRERDL